MIGLNIVFDQDGGRVGFAKSDCLFDKYAELLLEEEEREKERVGKSTDGVEGGDVSGERDGGVVEGIGISTDSNIGSSNDVGEDKGEGEDEVDMLHDCTDLAALAECSAFCNEEEKDTDKNEEFVGVGYIVKGKQSVAANCGSIEVVVEATCHGKLKNIEMLSLFYFL